MTHLLHWLQRLYSLDTLDTRFTAHSTPITGDAKSIPEKDARANAIANGASPSKWRTPEFYLYYFVHLTVVPMMFKVAMDVSQSAQKPIPLVSCMVQY